MSPWAFNPQLFIDQVLNFVLILMVVAGATMALLLLVTLTLYSIITLGHRRDDRDSMRGAGAQEVDHVH